MAKTYLLFVVVILCWSVNTIFIKIGVQSIPPVLFALIRLLIGTLTMFIFFALRQRIVLPTCKDLPLILSIGLVQMGIFQILVTLGMYYVDAGRATILVYSTPLWVTPIAVLFFKEQLGHMKLLGLIVSMVGLISLFNPTRFDWANSKIIVGNGLLLCASLCWAATMLHTRFGRWHRSPIELIPWQLLVGIIPPLFSLFFVPQEYHQSIHWTRMLIGITHIAASSPLHLVIGLV